jgi:dTDP-4-dehydrorhamnose 3,5-epimerase-like enzyme
MNIQGVFVKDLSLNIDDRGLLYEMTRLDWEECDLLYNGKEVIDKSLIQQVYVVRNTTECIRAFHRHEELVDLFCIVQGHAKFILAKDRNKGKYDVDRDNLDIINVSYLKPTLIGVPAGIWHGWEGSADAILICVANRLYKGVDHKGELDEERIPWDHYGKEIWGVKNK